MRSTGSVRIQAPIRGIASGSKAPPLPVARATGDNKLVDFITKKSYCMKQWNNYASDDDELANGDPFGQLEDANDEDKDADVDDDEALNNALDDANEP